MAKRRNQNRPSAGPRSPAFIASPGNKGQGNGTSAVAASAGSDERLHELEASLKEREDELELYRTQEAVVARTRSDLEERLASAEETIRADERRIRKDEQSRIEKDCQQLRSQAEQEAQDLRELAKMETEAAKRLAAVEAASLVEAARKEGGEILEQAQADRLALIEGGREKARGQLSELREQLEGQADDFACREKKLVLREDRCRSLEEELQKEQALLGQRKDRLREREDRCSEGRLQELELIGRDLQSRLEAALRNVEALREESRRQSELLDGREGRASEQLLEDLQQSRDQVQSLQCQLAGYPLLGELDRLRRDSAQVPCLREEIDRLGCQVRELEGRATRLALSRHEVESYRLESETLTVVNDHLRDSLNRLRAEYQGEHGKRFQALDRIDGEVAAAAAYRPESRVSTDLAEIAEHVRSYAGSRGLFYPLHALRAYLAGMASSRLIILQGLSGTGKSSLPRVFMEALGASCHLIHVQSSWRDRYELLGYNNDFHHRFRESEFTQAVYRASLPAEEQRVHTILLDECNLSRLEYYFADFLSLLEEPDESKWRVSLLDGSLGKAEEEEGPRGLVKGHYLRVTPNTWFVGTANQDESTFEITDKVYDRAQVLEFTHRHRTEGQYRAPGQWRVGARDLVGAFDRAENDGKDLDALKDDLIEEIDQQLHHSLGITFGNRIRMQMKRFIPVFVAAGGEQWEALDHQLDRKVLRKVKHRSDHGLAGKLTSLGAGLGGSLGDRWERFKLCQESLRRKIEDLEN